MRFWNASGVCLNLLYKLTTVKVFLTDADLNDNMNQLGEDEWPPLRKVSSLNLLKPKLAPYLSTFKEVLSLQLYAIFLCSGGICCFFLCCIRLAPLTLIAMTPDLGSRRSSYANTVAI